MVILEKYTGEKTYILPSGRVGTPEVIYGKYPALERFTYVVTTNDSREVMLAMDSLAVLRANNGIDASLSEEEAIAALQEILNNPPEVVSEPTAEERTATALEAIAAGQTTENAEALDILLTGEEA